MIEILEIIFQLLTEQLKVIQEVIAALKRFIEAFQDSSEFL